MSLEKECVHTKQKAKQFSFLTLTEHI